MKEVTLHENPLVPNAKLKQIYVAMVEARALDEASVRAAAKTKTAQMLSTYGQEAIRVSTAIELTNGDLVSDSCKGLVMQRIAGASTVSLLKQIEALGTGETKRTAARTRRSSTVQTLPWVEDAEERLQMALGAALSLKVLGSKNIMVAYAYARELPDGAWRRILKLASKLDLPMIFVILPSTARGRGGRSMSARAVACGVPGFPVDAGDAVALYRVAQESITRSRGDGGPILIECLSHCLPSVRKARPDDPIGQMRAFLLGRKIASRTWLDGVGKAFRAQCVRASARGRITSKRTR